MAYILQRHPLSQGALALAIEADIRFGPANALALRYTLLGPLDAITVPPEGPCARRDELWRTTCFELFISPGGDPYWEFNFSPSTAWAAYHFSAYRNGVAPEADVVIEQISPAHAGGRFELSVTARLPRPLAEHLHTARIGLSSVIETEAGELSYWALAHPPGKPDFHHPSSYTLPASSVMS